MFIRSNWPGLILTLALLGTVETSLAQCGVPDIAEDNDLGSTAVVPISNPLPNLNVSKTDPDYFEFDVPAGEVFTIYVVDDPAGAKVSIQLYRPPSNDLLDSSHPGFLPTKSASWSNDTGALATVFALIFVRHQESLDCNPNYTLSYTTAPSPCALGLDDAFEPNETCSTAATVAPGNYSDLVVRRETLGDADWYSIDVPSLSTVTATVNYVGANGDIELRLHNFCGSPLVDFAPSILDTETLSWTNPNPGTASAKLEVSMGFNKYPLVCNTYDLEVVIEDLPPTIVPYCFGDGSGTPCPCNNNSTAGHTGGCQNSQGDGAVLAASGSPSVMGDTLHFDLTSAGIVTAAILGSGDNRLPQMGGCIGCGFQLFDGLTCAGGNLLRHGARSTDLVGSTFASGGGWGPPSAPVNGLIGLNGFTAGQTRHFMVFYRDSIAGGCGTGVNFSNGVSVTFIP